MSSSAANGRVRASARSACATAAELTAPPLARPPLSSTFASGSAAPIMIAVSRSEATMTGMTAARMIVGIRFSSPSERSLAMK